MDADAAVANARKLGRLNVDNYEYPPPFLLALIAVSLADIGWEPYRAFLHEMPGLMSGEAFSAFRNPDAIGNNGSVPGLVFRLGLWGVPHMGFEAMRTWAGSTRSSSWLAPCGSRGASSPRGGSR